MKSTILKAALVMSFLLMTACSRPAEPSSQSASKPTKAELVARGKYLTTVGGCSDCHSPKVMTPHGPEPDPARLFSGHPEGERLESIIVTDDYLVINNGFTAFVGPWGVSFAANLSPDDTGIGNWTLDQFKTALRKGKYKGLESSRDLLPPMPWPMYRQMTDDDLEAVFTYLKSLPPQANHVPAPVSREKLKMIANNNLSQK